MKKTFLVMLFAFFCVASNAQMQQGVVKSRGRLAANGSAIPGTRISGATINVRNSGSLVSGSKGGFSFNVPNKTYALNSIIKQGYQLCDPDILNKVYQYSANPLVLIMDKPDNITADRLATEKNLRRTLQRQLEKKEDEIEALKVQKKITEKQYHNLLQELSNQQKKDVNLIEEMAERYSMIDFDDMDDYQRRIAFFIQNGELSRADSLLNTKGSMEKRSAELDRMDAAIKADAEELERRKKAHNKSIELKAKTLKEFAADCYSHYEICKLQHKNDSAAYWLELRASKDTLNSEWLTDCGFFYLNYLADYDQAKKYMQKAAEVATEGNNSSVEIRCITLVNLADVYFKSDKYKDAISLYTEARKISPQNSIAYIFATLGLADCYDDMNDDKKALGCILEADSLYKQGKYDITFVQYRIYKQMATCYDKIGDYQQALKFIDLILDLEKHDESSIENVRRIGTYNIIASTYKGMKQFDKAEEYYNKTLELALSTLDEKHPTLGTIYNNMGDLYYNLSRYKEALDCLNKAMEVQSERKNTEGYAQACSNLASVYSAVGNIQQEEQYEMEAYKVRLRLFGEDSPAMINQYNSLGTLYFNKRDFDIAKHFLEKAISIRKKEYGDMHPSLFSSYSYMGGICMQLGDFEGALDWFLQNLEIAKHYYGEENPKVATVYNNIGGIYLNLRKYDDAIAHIQKALNIHLSVYGENNADVAADYNGLAQTYMAMERYEDAIANFNKAIEIRKIVFGANSVKLKSLYGFMKEIYKKMENEEKVKYYDTLLNELQQ